MPDLRVAILGVGMMGTFHADALTRRIRGAVVSVVSDFDADRARAVAGQIGARIENDPIAAINAEDVDAVLIASPGAAHEMQLNACLDRGIPTLCEKPLTTDMASSLAMVRREVAIGRQLIQVGFMRRFDPEYVALKRLIVDGGLGNPLIMHCVHRNPSVPDFFNSEYMIRDSVVHEVDTARFLLGEEITAVSVIKCRATSAAPPGTSDPMIVVFETESGCIVTDEIYVRTGVAYEVRTEVVGEQGSAMIGMDTNLVRKTTEGRWGGQITSGFVERFGRAYDIELQRWVDAAKSGTVDGPGSWDGYAAVAVCEAGVKAVRTGRRVPVSLNSPAGGPLWSTARDEVAEPEPGITAPDLIGDRP